MLSKVISCCHGDPDPVIGNLIRKSCFWHVYMGAEFEKDRLLVAQREILLRGNTSYVKCVYCLLKRSKFFYMDDQQSQSLCHICKTSV